MGSLSYQGNLNFNGADTVTVVSTDANAVSASDSVQTTLASDNSAAVCSPFSARTVAEDTALTFTGANTISVNDVDTNLATTSLTVGNRSEERRVRKECRIRWGTND